MSLSKDFIEFIECLNARRVDYLLVGGHALAFQRHYAHGITPLYPGADAAQARHGKVRAVAYRIHSGFWDPIDSPDYIVTEINSLIPQSWWTKRRGNVYDPPYDPAWLEAHYTQVFKVERAFGIEMANVWQKKTSEGEEMEQTMAVYPDCASFGNPRNFLALSFQPHP